jgi:WD40 repeat protein
MALLPIFVGPFAVAQRSEALGLGPAPPATLAAAQDLYERPVLVIDQGMHTLLVNAISVDKAGEFIATGSDDKTVRIWSTFDGKLLRTIRVPAGPDFIGQVFTVAIGPEGDVVAAGGNMEDFIASPIYLFDRVSGRMIKRKVCFLCVSSTRLIFSPDGRYLASLFARGGLRVFDRDQGWSQVFRDTDYGAESYGGSFSDDGRFATSSFDRKIRLYGREFNSIIPRQEVSVEHAPLGVALNPNGSLLAVGYYDVPLVALLDGHSLARLPGPETDGLDNGGLHAIAWSSDGQTFFAAGRHRDGTRNTTLLAWDDAGRGTRRALSTCVSDEVRGLVPVAAGGLLIATADPCITLLESNGGTRWAHRRPGADFRDQDRSFAVSADGAIVDFGFERHGASPLRFDLRALTLGNRPADNLTKPPKQDGLPVGTWENSERPTLYGKPIDLIPWETSRSLAIHPDNHRFVLGATWTIRAEDANGQVLWIRPVPHDAWAVNITVDGRLVVAAHADGTIRWYRMDDGRELLALQVLGDKKNWVAWTPEGFYAATPGAYGVLRWHVNRGADASADTVPVSAIPKLNRPDALPLILQELETARALGIADLAAARRDVQLATGAKQAPGARLHVLSIGISNYGEKAKSLRLKFADKDAKDIANPLVNTQSSEFNKLGGLYAEVLPIYLHDETANKRTIFEAFASMQRNMTNGSGQDLAVVMFSGHGAMIDDQLYLLPYGVEAGTLAALKADAIPASQIQSEVKKLAEHGRVLVLLDACHSGAVAADGSKLPTNADLLRSVMASSNVSVLTSSSAEEASREDEAWENGAFTKVLIQAFGREADENHDGLISMSELTAYLSAQIGMLTGDRQHPGIEQRFQSDIFVAGL